MDKAGQPGYGVGLSNLYSREPGGHSPRVGASKEESSAKPSRALKPVGLKYGNLQKTKKNDHSSTESLETVLPVPTTRAKPTAAPITVGASKGESSAKPSRALKPVGLKYGNLQKTKKNDHSSTESLETVLPVPTTRAKPTAAPITGLKPRIPLTPPTGKKLGRNQIGWKGQEMKVLPHHSADVKKNSKTDGEVPKQHAQKVLKAVKDRNNRDENRKVDDHKVHGIDTESPPINSKLDSPPVTVHASDEVQSHRSTIDHDQNAKKFDGPPDGPSNTIGIVKDIFMSDETRYRKTKAAFGLICGLIFGLVFFGMLYLSLETGWRISLFIALPVTFLVVLGLALTVRTRCVATLMIPTLCTSEGRAVLYAVIIALLLSGPIQNIYLNSEEMADSMSCSFEMAVNHSRDLQEATQLVVNSYVDALTNGADGLRESSQTLDNLFSTIERQFNGLDSGLSAFHDTITGIADDCERSLVTARDECTDGVNDGQRECEEALSVDVGVDIPTGGDIPFGGGVPGIPGVPGFGRKRRALRVPRSGPDEVCSLLNIDDVCDLLNIEDVCHTNLITDDVLMLLAQLRNLKDIFRVDVVVSSNFSNRDELNGSVQGIQEAVREELQRTHDILMRIFEITEKILAFSLLWLVFRSYTYYRKFCTKDKFDNFYITKGFVELDEQRKKGGEESLLPLKKSERRHYVDLKSFKLSKPEKGLFKVGLLMVFMHATISVIVIVVDYGLYWLLFILNEHGAFSYVFESMGRTDITVGGDGFLSDFVRWMFTDGSMTASNYTVTIDTAICLPQPTEPRSGNAIIIGVLYLFTLSTVLCQAYMLRLRRSIASYFYPEREVERIVFLYDKALDRRKSLFRILRNIIVRKKKEKERADDISLLFLLTKKCPCVAKVPGLLGSRSKYCHGCGAKDMNGDFHACSDGSCGCKYCDECAKIVGGICACNESIHDVGNHEAKSQC